MRQHEIAFNAALIGAEGGLALLREGGGAAAATAAHAWGNSKQAWHLKRCSRRASEKLARSVEERIRGFCCLQMRKKR